MKILVTGVPESGKSTLVQSVIAAYPKKQGFITREMRENGDRSGFEIVTAAGHVKTLAQVKIKSAHQVSRYGVDVDGFADMLPELENFNPDDLLYIDEIGQMELYAGNFAPLVWRYIEAPNVFLGTVSKVFSDATTQSLLKDSRITLVDIDVLGRNAARTRVTALLGI